MTVVYIDQLFFLNLIANYLLLLGAGRVTGSVLRRLRIVLGAALGGGYAVLLLFPGLEWLGAWPCKVLSGILMVLVAYWGERRLIRVSAIFFGASAGLAGLVLAVELFGGASMSLQNKVLYSDFDLRLLLLLFVICYFVMSLFFRRAGRHGSRELVGVEIEIMSERIALTALLDSGHTITDPATNRPVVVVSAPCLSHLLPGKVDPAQPVEGIKLCRMAGINGARLIPYRAVGIDCGMLLALQSKSVRMGERQLGGLLIALSPNPVDDGGGYQAIIGGV